MASPGHCLPMHVRRVLIRCSASAPTIALSTFPSIYKYFPTYSTLSHFHSSRHSFKSFHTQSFSTSSSSGSSRPTQKKKTQYPKDAVVRTTKSLNSPRLDVCLSVGFNVSRALADAAITAGHVTVNKKICKKKDQKIVANDIIKCLSSHLKPSKQGKMKVMEIQKRPETSRAKRAYTLDSMFAPELARPKPPPVVPAQAANSMQYRRK